MDSSRPGFGPVCPAHLKGVWSDRDLGELDAKATLQMCCCAVGAHFPAGGGRRDTAARDYCFYMKVQAVKSLWSCLDGWWMSKWFPHGWYGPKLVCSFSIPHTSIAMHRLFWYLSVRTSVNLFRNQSSIIGEGAFIVLHTMARQNKFALSLWHPVVFWAVPQRGGHVPVMWLCSHDTCMWPIISQPWWHIYHTPFFFSEVSPHAAHTHMALLGPSAGAYCLWRANMARKKKSQRYKLQCKKCFQTVTHRVACIRPGDAYLKVEKYPPNRGCHTCQTRCWTNYAGCPHFWWFSFSFFAILKMKISTITQKQILA